MRDPGERFVNVYQTPPRGALLYGPGWWTREQAEHVPHMSRLGRIVYRLRVIPKTTKGEPPCLDYPTR